MENKKRLYPWKEFLPDMYERIIPALKSHPTKFKGVWGPPRGGLIIAVMISHELGIPLITLPRWIMVIFAFLSLAKKIIITDDIADTGKTLAPFHKSVIVTPYYHRQSIVVPDIWLHEKTDAFVVFPWEKE